MINDKMALAVYAASKFFGNESWYQKIVSDYKTRIYSYHGLNVYDFSRKGFAAIFPASREEFKIFDFITGNYLNVKRSGERELTIHDEAEAKPRILQL